MTDPISHMIIALRLKRSGKSFAQIAYVMSLGNKMKAMRLVRRAERFEEKMKEWQSMEEGK